MVIQNAFCVEQNVQQITHRKLCQYSLAVPGLQAGQVSMVCGGEADARHINEAAAVI